MTTTALDINPIEKLWDEMHRKVRMITPRNIRNI